MSANGNHAHVGGAPVRSLPPGYTEEDRFWVRLAFLHGQPLRALPADGATAQALARPSVPRPATGVLCWGGWCVPADLDYTSGRIDAGNFNPPDRGCGATMHITYAQGTVGLDAHYDGAHGWQLSAGGVSELRRVAAAVATDEAILMATRPAPAVELQGPSVAARFRTDDHRFTVSFDARAFLVRASDDALRAIINVDYQGDAATDAVALDMADRRLNAELVAAFDYLGALQEGTQTRRETVGFECSLDATQFLRWMQQHRPRALALELCERHGVRLERIPSGASAGLWRWLRPNGEDEFRGPFASAVYAALDACERLTLVEQEIREFGV